MAYLHRLRIKVSKHATLSLLLVLLVSGLLLLYFEPHVKHVRHPLLKVYFDNKLDERTEYYTSEPDRDDQQPVEDEESFYKRNMILRKHLPAPFRLNKPDHTYRNLLEVTPPSFLTNFKTPCWVEELETSHPYDGPLIYPNNIRLPTVRKTMSERFSRMMHNGSCWRLRCLPYFYVGGIQKCGTSELYNKLAMHPNIIRGPIKEPHFWTRLRAGYTHVGFLPIGKYIDLFDAVAEEIRQNVTPSEAHMGARGYHPKIFGEGSVSTMFENDYWYNLPENRGLTQPKHGIAEYIHHITPAARFIMAVRNPADRLYSDYLHLYKTPQDKTASIFHQLVESSVALINECFQRKTPLECVRDKQMAQECKLHLRQGFYIVFLKEWLKVFPLKQIHIVRLEDIKDNRIDTLNKVSAFLEVGPFPPGVASEIAGMLPRNENTNTYEPMWNNTREILMKLYRPFNEQLADFLKDKKYLWS